MGNTINLENSFKKNGFLEDGIKSGHWIKKIDNFRVIHCYFPNKQHTAKNWLVIEEEQFMLKQPTRFIKFNSFIKDENDLQYLLKLII